MYKIKKITNYLKSPKTTDELYDQLKDDDFEWNKEQLELYLKLDKNIKSESDKWVIEESPLEDQLLLFIEMKIASASRGVVKVEDIIKDLPAHLPFTPEQIITIVKNSNTLQSPNSKVITRK